MANTRVSEAEEAVRKLKRFLETTDHHHLFGALDRAQDEKEAFVVIAGHLLASLAGECIQWFASPLSVDVMHMRIRYSKYQSRTRKICAGE